MKRFLKIADYCCGEDTRRNVFEPLLADYQAEVRNDLSLRARLRWWWAMTSTLLICLPRAAFAGLPVALAIDLLARGVGFAAIAVAAQAAIAAVLRHPSAVPISLMTTLPFAVVPVIWRIRVSGLPAHQRRLAAIALAATLAVLNAASAGAWLVRLALAAQILIVALVGWRLGHPVFYEPSNMLRRPWVKAWLVACNFQWSSWPVAIAMGIGYNGFWPEQMLLTTVISAAVYVSIRNEQMRSHS